MSQVLQIELDTQTYRTALERLRAGLLDASPLMAGIALELRAEANMQFKAQAGPEGPWPSLAERTLAQRRKKGTWPGRMLQVTGQLASSLQASHDQQSATLSTNKPYAAIQQFGGKAGKGRRTNVPARAYLPIMGNASQAKLSDHAHQMISAIVRDYLDRKLTDQT